MFTEVLIPYMVEIGVTLVILFAWWFVRHKRKPQQEQLSGPSDDGFWAGLGRTRNALASGLGHFFNSDTVGDARFEALETRDAPNWSV